ncbi:selenocysteine-specific translation elongation factor, partial [Kineococcus sp. T13]|uniref:selenocysteine-specific translation elongation factor n=1 Tax=Kineococcus vitellinus TaxID=2696565 RepID=UPI0014120486
MHVVATAGHVDHGKSTLVRALTGRDPDRFAEEKRRGLTIDLGFAWTRLPGAGPVAFVDVPGHERFVPTMLAGAGPVPATVFVVAADGGWMPQSAEHLAALDALGVRHGLLVVTRADLADPAAATGRALAELERTSLGRVPAVACSAVTGQGMDEVRAALVRLLAALPAPQAQAPVRLWVDRSFTVKGAGTVVTGTLGAGTVAVGDELELRGTRVRVRSVQSLETEVERAGAVARVALNLRGVDRHDVRRGDALLTPGTHVHTDVVDVRLPVGEEDWQGAGQLVVHVGSAAVPARVRPLGIDAADTAG